MPAWLALGLDGETRQSSHRVRGQGGVQELRHVQADCGCEEVPPSAKRAGIQPEAEQWQASLQQEVDD